MKIESLIREVEALRTSVREAEQRNVDVLARVRDRHRASALNLVHYVALRSHDLRELQDRLSAVGISSLGRMESGVLGHLEVVLRALRAQLADPVPVSVPGSGNPAGEAGGAEAGGGSGDAVPAVPLTPSAGREILSRNTSRLLGDSRADRMTRIMVTMPSQAAHDDGLVAAMVDAGMDLARINCAHDDREAWHAMITSIRAHRVEGRRPPLVAMDLAGPKLRTGPLLPGPQVLKIRPQRDASGVVTARSLVWLGELDEDAAKGIEGALSAEVLPLGDGSGDVISALNEGDELRLTDARGSDRSLWVEARGKAGLLVSADKTVYWQTGTEVCSDRGVLTIGEIPGIEQSMRVHVGDEIVLSRSMEPRPAVTEPPFVIGCSLPQVFDDVAVGDEVSIDDGKIATRVEAVSHDEISLRVESAGPSGTKLKAEKGINFPDTDISVPALTPEDLSHVPFVAEHADMVNMSFVRAADDVAALIDALEAEDAHNVDITLKIETVAAFEALPRMLLEAMRWEDVGVMIARGDLAVEAGFERMAELQEEILWLCEAGHVPVIWATQVLESLAKSGLPSRAEITDAAMAQRAECVMLNKGPFIEEAIAALSDILTRMGGHTDKKRDMLRQLKSWSL
ncbi:pyruvate kinase [Brevibacterium daeguense]|uniref:pyruvate kinase n=1 Tax=Brevibacterium daeguense TaxID=909936 RepID=A0ABP8EJ80_9MICO|nr:pyruvate kinase [Brevibacterium daeguense]